MTSWGELLAQGRLASEPSSRAEIRQLFSIAERELQDANVRGLSVAGRFGHGYAAARSLATIVVRASGFRIKAGEGGHHLTFHLLTLADSGFGDRAVFFDRCRRKRNDMLYTRAGHVAGTEAEELLRTAAAFSNEVLGG